MKAHRSRTANTSAADEAALSAIPQQMIDAWNRGSGTDFAAPFSDEADFVAFEGTHLEGRRQIEAFHQQIFDTVVKGSRLQRCIVKFVRFLRPDLAVMHAVVSVTLPGHTSPSPSRESMQMFVASKRGEQWAVEAVLNARRLTMEQQFMSDDFESLPAEARGEVRNLIASLKERHAGLQRPAPR